jgi:phosphatidylglycerol:prolipoprotein diacylglycerol transferase
MRQTLFHLPETILGIRLFGFGWAFAVVSVLGLAAIGRSARAAGWTQALKVWSPTLVMALIVIVAVLPAIERMPSVAPGDDLPNHGLPVRGFGVMLFLACGSAVALAARRAAARGIDPEIIYQLAVSFFVLGILGARLAFVLQYWDRFQIRSVLEFLRALIGIAEGGLVVYGSLAGAFLAFVLFTYRQRISARRLGDVIAPCLMLGLAIGRIGCFLNGCCWGGLTDLPWGTRFPATAPSYAAQADQGLHWGFRWSDRQGRPIVQVVLPNGPAARAGLRAGDALLSVGSWSLDDTTPGLRRLTGLMAALHAGRTAIPVRTVDGRSFELKRPAAPDRTLPIHPTQIYSSINALILLALVLAFDRQRFRDGATAALTLTLYPITRFILEAIRDDEGGLWGTPLTISQWISILVLGLATMLWFRIYGRDSRGQRGLSQDAHVRTIQSVP